MMINLEFFTKLLSSHITSKIIVALLFLFLFGCGDFLSDDDASSSSSSSVAAKIELNVTNIWTLELGTTFQLEVSFTPSDTQNKELEWSSLNSEIVEVSNTGLLTAKNIGVTSITVTSKEDSPRTDQISIFVKSSAAVAGAMSTCAIDAQNKSWCWGKGGDGQLGNGALVRKFIPTEVSGGYNFTQITAGENFTCGLNNAGLTWCWGSNTNGRQGSNSGQFNNVPTQVSGEHVFHSISSGGGHTCGLKVIGEVWCWGAGAKGQLGNGDKKDQITPVKVSGELKISTISAGQNHTCALDTTDVAWCWGDNASKQLGNSDITDESSIPVKVSGNQLFIFISSGFSHTCGIKVDFTGWCWGANESQQLGQDASETESAPVEVSHDHIYIAISAMNQYSCGLILDHINEKGVIENTSIVCWGSGKNGRRGDGTTTTTKAPTRIKTNINSFVGMADGASNQHMCGITSEKAVYCWGVGSEGQIGVAGNLSDKDEPQDVNTPF